MKASGIIYTNAEVVEADRIDDSDSGAVPDASTKRETSDMDEHFLLWKFREDCIQYICINNYSISQAWSFLLGAK